MWTPDKWVKKSGEYLGKGWDEWKKSNGHLTSEGSIFWRAMSSGADLENSCRSRINS
jgi:hypothetical protein